MVRASTCKAKMEIRWCPLKEKGSLLLCAFVFKPCSIAIRSPLIGLVVCFFLYFIWKKNEGLLNIDQPLQKMGGKEFYWETSTK